MGRFAGSSDNTEGGLGVPVVVEGRPSRRTRGCGLRSAGVPLGAMRTRNVRVQCGPRGVLRGQWMGERRGFAGSSQCIDGA